MLDTNRFGVSNNLRSRWDNTNVKFLCHRPEDDSEVFAAEILALVRNGDRIALSVSRHRLDLLVDEGEHAKRRSTHRPVATPAGRGYARLYMQSVLQAEEGCDFDFLRKI